MIKPERFVKMFGKKEEKKIVKFAQIATADGRPTLLFDGETVPTTKKYPYLSTYTPEVGNRVMVVHGVVVGKIL